CAVSKRLTRDTASNARSSLDTVASCSAAGSVATPATFAIGSSAMRQIGQSPGDDDFTSGCIGQTNDGRADAAAAAGVLLTLRATTATTRPPAAIATSKILLATIAAVDRDPRITRSASLTAPAPRRPGSAGCSPWWPGAPAAR